MKYCNLADINFNLMIDLYRFSILITQWIKMSRFNPDNIKLFNNADEVEYSNFYSHHEQVDSIAQSKRFQKLYKLQESILQKINEITGASSIEKSIKNLLDNQFGKLNQQIKEINTKMSSIFNKLDQKKKQSNCDSNSIMLDDKDSQQKSNVSAEGYHSEIELSAIINIDQNKTQYPKAGPFLYFDSYAPDEYDQSIMLFEGHNDYSKLFDNRDALFRELQDVFVEMDLKFQRCQRLYDFETMKETNFHEKIDKKMNVFLLMELENNQLLGAFTHLCFDPQPNYIPKQNPKSFFCNFKKNIFVYASRFNKTHSYDKNYLIFGNWEIKIKAGEQILATNWGTNGDCFMNRYYGRSEKTNIKLEWMFGVGFENNQIKMKRYCIYQFT